MGCRVGIPTDPDERKVYWKRRHPGLRGWKMLTGAKIAVVLSPAAAGYGLATGAVVIWSIALLVCGIAIGVIAWHESQ